MAKLVTKCKFIKPDSDKNMGGYAKYIATREAVEKLDDSIKYAPATVKQKQFIEKLLKDFPDSKDMLEYEDYVKTPTTGNASEFISRVVEENIHEEMDVKTYADYIATRPRVEHFGSHGLFTDDGVQVKLSSVSKELNLHEGNVWTFIISLRREDAIRLGFDEGKRWRDMLRSNTQELANSLKIPLENLKWYAAFHNESHHPHVHLIAYSVNEQEGYLTRQGVKNLRSALANDIFALDLYCLYDEQTKLRDELRRVGREEVEAIVKAIKAENYCNPKVEEMLVLLSDRLSKTKGKKVYGYLKTDVKALVVGIVEELSKDERIQKLYDLWYEQTEEIKRIYTESMPPRIPLSQNKEFKTIRNAVIQEAMKLLWNPNDTKEWKEEEGKERNEKEQEEASDEQAFFVARGVESILYYMSKALQDRIKTSEESSCGSDKKLRRLLREKKEAQGLKQ